MDECAEPFETLKQILRHVRDPRALDRHPWARSLFVQETLAGSPRLAEAGPGEQLVAALARLFPQLKPPAPPRRGKRIDSRWGEFGLLAAMYFTPFNHGRPYPTSLIEAWGRIDEAILYFVYGKPAQLLSPEQIQKYQLVGEDLEYGSASTLSDWHKKGLQRFAGLVLDQERYLSRTQVQPSVIFEQPEFTPSTRSNEMSAKTKGILWAGLAVALLFFMSMLAFKGWKIYQRAEKVYQDAATVHESLQGASEVKAVEAAVPQVTTLRNDLTAFREEARPVLWLGPWLRWVPVYGNDLAAAPQLVDLGEHLLNASLLAAQAARPLLDQIDSGSSSYDPASLTHLLFQAQPQLQAARAELDQALKARDSLNADRLSPRLRGLLVGDLDPLLKRADNGLSLAAALPNVLGAGSSGPKTYLLLVQNEDELRPTGGFITSVGNLVLQNGEVISLKFEEVGAQEDWTKPYPAAPWQLQEYMNSRVLILRDANWFADFPTSAKWAEALYAYTHDHSVDGVFAFDQHFLVMLLGKIGPLTVENAPYPLTAQNVVEYMRLAKERMPEEASDPNWYYKAFIGKIGEAVLMDLVNGREHDWQGIAQVVSQALEERHLLLQFDDPTIGALTAQHGWDHEVRAGNGDYLLVTDSNVGFNKTNAVVDASLAYEIDLGNLSWPESILTVTRKNNAASGVPCVQWNDAGQIQGEKYYPIDRCYWDYLRVYKQAGAKLLDATPHAVPAEWMMLGQAVPARVDELDENLPGVQGYGTLLVVPGGETLSTRFHFALPVNSLSIDTASHQVTYRLLVQKQPGTLAVPLAIRIRLPSQATLVSSSPQASVQDHELLIATDLRRDVEVEVVFSIP